MSDKLLCPYCNKEITAAAPFMLEHSIVLQNSAWQLGFNSGRADGIEAAAMYVLEHGVSERGYTAAGIRSLKPETK